jgi:hypothetical protein
MRERQRGETRERAERAAHRALMMMAVSVSAMLVGLAVRLTMTGDQSQHRTQCFRRGWGEALHSDRETLEALDRIRRTIGEYNFAGQYQQSPAPLGGGLVKGEWFKRYRGAPPETIGIDRRCSGRSQCHAGPSFHVVD